MACEEQNCGSVAAEAIEHAPRGGDDGDDEHKMHQAALKEAGAEIINRANSRGLRIAGWVIQVRKGAILKMDARERLEKILGTPHLPEMVFGDSSLELVHEASGIRIHFNALDALHGWRQESLPPVEVPAAAKWKFRSKPNQEVILDYDYTFTTPYRGSDECLQVEEEEEEERQLTPNGVVEWVQSSEKIDMVALQARDPILFYDEVVLYEDELADNGVALLSVKVRIMPSCWYLLLRFWLRVDGVLMRLRDTRMFSRFRSVDDDDPSEKKKKTPVVIRELCDKEDTFHALVLRGLTSDPAMYSDPSVAGEKLQLQQQICEKLRLISNFKQ
jgi:type 2A phosphatase activator TIP41